MLGHKLAQTFQEEFETWVTLRRNNRVFEEIGFRETEKILHGVYAENFDSVLKAVGMARPNVIVNAIGAIKQLPSGKDVSLVLAVNAIFPHRLELLCRAINARLITISTDCIFNGKKGMYCEDDITDAEDLYGKSKNLGEILADNCLTIRTSIVGRELETSHGLLEWFLSNRGKTVKGYKNAIFSGLPTVTLSEIIASIVKDHPDLNGLYHVSSNAISKLELITLFNEFFNADVQIEVDEQFVIDRSLNSNRFRNAIGFRPDTWRKMVEKMANDTTPYDKLRRQLWN